MDGNRGATPQPALPSLYCSVRLSQGVLPEVAPVSRQEISRHKVLLAALLVFLAIPFARAGEYSHARVVRLSLVEGDVQVISADQPGWQKAIVNMPVREGMSIATAQGRAEIEFESGATARIADNSVLQFTELALADGDRITRLILTQGTASIYTNRERHERFEVQAGKLQIAIRDNAHFRIDVFEDGASLSVQKGNVEVATAGNSQRINKGQTLALRNDAPDQIVMERNRASDSWDHWVADRDNALNVGRNESLQYVSSPVSYGLSDLSYYGGWYNYGGYGNCWRPYGVSLGWSPFYSGTWSYLPGFGFTWTSFEPWGWMPYHYGGWVFSPTLGWLWVPGSFHAWNPGAVHWYRTAGTVGWVPISPHDRPGVTPQNLPHGVITNTATGLATGSPHKLGFLPAGESPRFLSDPRADQEMVRTGEQIRAAAESRATSAGSRIGVAADHNPASVNEGAQAAAPAHVGPAPPRRMSERESSTKPAHVYTVVPAAPSTSAAAPAAAPHGGSARPSSSSPGPRPAPPSSAPRPAPSSSAPRPASSAPAPRSSPAPHPSSSRPPSSRPR